MSTPIKSETTVFNPFMTLNSTQKRIIASGVIGNFLENFDFMLCAFLAQFIAMTFLPPSSMVNNVFNIFSIFFIGYLSRPLGGLLIGLYADQIGRKSALIFSIVMVGICTAIIGIIPSYQSIGILATLLFTFFRILQNICVGGEYISSIAYLIENADKRARGFYGSWVSVGFNMGSLFASILVFILIYFIESNMLPTWSWRIIFIVSLFGTGVGFWIRRSLPESLEYIYENADGVVQKKRDILRLAIHFIKTYPSRCFGIMTVAWLGVAETAAIFVYSPIHMTTINHFSQYQAMGINTISLLFLIPLIPIFGYLSDHYSKIKLLILSSFAFFILAIPYFMVLSSGNLKQILTLKLLFCVPSACYYAIAPVLITESFPIRLRCTSLALIYQMTLSIAAGTTPLAMLYLANHTSRMTYSPGYYLIGCCILGLIGLRLLSAHKTDQIEVNHELFLTKPIEDL